MKANYDAERAVIGGIVLDAEKILPIAALELRPDDFFVPEFRMLYAVCMDLSRDGKPVDAVTLISKVGAEHRSTVLTCAESLPSLSGIDFYIKAVKTTSQKINALERAQELIAAIETEGLEKCREISGEISKALIGESRIQSIDAKTGFLDFIDRAEKPRNYIKSGFYKLDRVARVEHGDYVIIGGRPSTGKTAFKLQIMLNIAKKEKVIYFSLETSKEKAMDRLICSYTRTSKDEIKDGKIQNWDAITAAYDTFKDLKFEIVEASGWTVSQIEAYTIQRGAKVIFIDYLSIIRGQGKTVLERVTNISVDLHVMAQKNKCAIYALSQLSRIGKEEPGLESLRESGQIEQDADVVLLLHTEEEDTQNADRKLIVAKNKEGATGKMTLSFHGAIQTFYQQEDDRYGR